MAPSINVAPIISWVSLVLAVGLHLLHLPGGILWWLGLFLASTRSVAPELTGQDEAKNPIPANTYEEGRLRKHRELCPPCFLEATDPGRSVRVPLVAATDRVGPRGPDRCCHVAPADVRPDPRMVVGDRRRDGGARGDLPVRHVARHGRRTGRSDTAGVGR